jgi:hypothetical protein
MQRLSITHQALRGFIAFTRLKNTVDLQSFKECTIRTATWVGTLLASNDWPMQTLLALILGAVLAAVGGFADTLVGIWIDRSRRAKDAAM